MLEHHPPPPPPAERTSPSWEQAPPGSTPLEQAPSAGSRHPPCAVHAGRCGQQASVMHPTGMQSCFCIIFFCDAFFTSVLDERCFSFSTSVYSEFLLPQF